MLDARETLDHVTFRAGTVEDGDKLVGHYRAFFAFSDLPGLGLAFSDENMGQWVRRVISTGAAPHILALDRHAGGIVGSIDYFIDRNIAAQPFANLDKLFVLPEWRLSAIGRVLLSLAMQDAKAAGCVAFRAGLSAGASYSKNLFHRLGFDETPSSVLMARRL